MSDTLRIVIPMSPPKGLMTNHRNRSHWTGITDDRDALKTVTKTSIDWDPDIDPPYGSYDIEVRVIWGPDDYPSEKRFPDVDNIPSAIKPAIDQLQEMGVIENDKLCRHYGIAQQFGDSGAIVLNITEVSDE